MNFKDAVEKILVQHGDLFKSLAEHDTLEYDASQWILQNIDELKDKLKQLTPKEEDVNPESLRSIYLSQYEEEAVRIIRAEVTEAFKLDPENALRIDADCVKLVARELLKPIKEE